MTEDIGLFDALYSQRAIRYFKPDPVSDELIHKLIEAATKAPSGSNKQGWKFLVIRDQATKDIIGDYYKRGWEITWRKAIMWEAAYRGQSQSSFFPVHARRSSEYLARHIAESPVLIMACIDCIKLMTSPPYGDSQTTVAYGQFSRLAAEWIGLPNARKVDKLAMGGLRSKDTLTDSPVSSAVEKIRSVDEKRAEEVSAFYIDLDRSINSIAHVCSPHATICYVVGNRRVKGVLLPTDEFVVDAFRQHGFVHKTTIVRNIPNKRMPKKNSPSNIAGETSTTMHEENIVVCQRTNHRC